MSFLKRLFGAGTREPEQKAPAEEDYQGYRLVADPQKEEGQFRLAGTIERQVEGEVRTHRLIRADLFTSADDAAAAFFRKARQVIDEQGDRLFG
jgi:hypothetical protein